MQAILFDKSVFTTKEARAWLKKHGKKPIARVRETDRYYRYRITEPEADATYRTKRIKDGIKIVFEPVALKNRRKFES